jgi:hypothetical protein
MSVPCLARNRVGEPVDYSGDALRLGGDLAQLEDVRSGPFNPVFRARGQNHEVVMKLFADSVNDPALLALLVLGTTKMLDEMNESVQ